MATSSKKHNPDVLAEDKTPLMHTLCVEIKNGSALTDKIHLLSDLARKCGNILVHKLNNELQQVQQTKKYKTIVKLIKNNNGNDRPYRAQLEELYAKHNLTKSYCEKTMTSIYNKINQGRKYKLPSVFAQSRADDIFLGLRKVLDNKKYDRVKSLHYLPFTKLPALKAKEIKRGIIISVKDGKLQCKFDGEILALDIKDQFIREEIDAITKYLTNSQQIKDAAEKYNAIPRKKGEIVVPFSTYRPCFASFVPKKMKGKKRLYLHICVEGVPVDKKDKNGNLRYKKGEGRCAFDLGTQHVAKDGDTGPFLANLGDIDGCLEKSAKKRANLSRKIIRSRQATNRNNYNSNGKIKKGAHDSNVSKKRKRCEEKRRDLYRKDAATHKTVNYYIVNVISEDCSEVVTEDNNVRSWSARGKPAPLPNGQIGRKHRFGGTVINHCPGQVNARLLQKMRERGGHFYQVPRDYRASQYDHTSDSYIKKTLSQRTFNLSDGTLVQRDWYSAFLLYCYDSSTNSIDKVKCKKEFPKHYKKFLKYVAALKNKKIKIVNSGIKV